MSDYDQNIRQRVHQMRAASLPVQPVQQPSQPVQQPVQPVEFKTANNNAGFLTVFLGVLAVLMIVMVGFIMVSGKLSARRSVPSQEQQLSPNSPQYVNPQYVNPDYLAGYATRSEMRNADRSLEQKIDGVDQRLNIFAHRVWLLGLSHNENTNIHNKYHPDERGYITLDKEWRMSSMPETMNLTPQQKEELRHWIK